MLEFGELLAWFWIAVHIAAWIAMAYSAFFVYKAIKKKHQDAEDENRDDNNWHDTSHNDENKS